VTMEIALGKIITMFRFQYLGLVAGFLLFLEHPSFAQEKEIQPIPKVILHKNDRHIWCVAYSPDGQLIAGGGGGYVGTSGELKVWDLKTQKLIVDLTEPASVRWVVFSPDGKLLATAEHDRTAKLRDIKTGKTLRVFKGHTSGLDTVAFSPDGKKLATTSWDKTAKIWDLNTGEVLLTLEGHEKEVYSLAFHPDGKRLVTGCQDGTGKIWDVQSGKEILTLKGHDDTMHCVAYSPSGKLIATVGWDRLIKIWDAEKGSLITELQGHSLECLAVAFSPDGKRIATVSGPWGRNQPPVPGEIILWDLVSRKQLANFRGHDQRIFGVTFSPDGTQLATASWDQTIKVWDVAQLLIPKK